MNWVLHIRNKTKKEFCRFPMKDRCYIAEALREIKENPFFGDIIKLDVENFWRRRIGAYRIFYEIITSKKIVYVFRIERRNSKTY
ncbi:type II toxin-antitoxin system RelE/ParE family toxin [Candidatus Wolfebacteria bacterium]|nr:type II toxin-antitoxin system RelE/ParE family toxin [Candidatus Wolfebacteria bacterium]